jgi:hypothetical protein
MKRELRVRLALAGFLKDTLQEITKKKVQSEKGDSTTAQMLTEFVEKARSGSHISTTDITKFARLFKVSADRQDRGLRTRYLPAEHLLDARTSTIRVQGPFANGTT